MPIENPNWNPEKVDALAKLWSQYPPLYNSSLPDYKDRNLRRSCIREISAKLGVDVYEVAAKMKNLRGQYTKERAKSRLRSSVGGGGDGEGGPENGGNGAGDEGDSSAATVVIQSKWKYLKVLSFLDDFINTAPPTRKSPTQDPDLSSMYSLVVDGQRYCAASNRQKPTDASTHLHGPSMVSRHFPSLNSAPPIAAQMPAPTATDNAKPSDFSTKKQTSANISCHEIPPSIPNINFQQNMAIAAAARPTGGFQIPLNGPMGKCQAPSSGPTTRFHPLASPGFSRSTTGSSLVHHTPSGHQLPLQSPATGHMSSQHRVTTSSGLSGTALQSTSRRMLNSFTNRHLTAPTIRHATRGTASTGATYGADDVRECQRLPTRKRPLSPNTRAGEAHAHFAKRRATAAFESHLEVFSRYVASELSFVANEDCFRWAKAEIQRVLLEAQERSSPEYDDVAATSSEIEYDDGGNRQDLGDTSDAGQSMCNEANARSVVAALNSAAAIDAGGMTRYVNTNGNCQGNVFENDINNPNAEDDLSRSDGSDNVHERVDNGPGRLPESFREHLARDLTRLLPTSEDVNSDRENGFHGDVDVTSPGFDFEDAEKERDLATGSAAYSIAFPGDQGGLDANEGRNEASGDAGNVGDRSEGREQFHGGKLEAELDTMQSNRTASHSSSSERESNGKGGVYKADDDPMELAELSDSGNTDGLITPGSLPGGDGIASCNSPTLNGCLDIGASLLEAKVEFE